MYRSFLAFFMGCLILSSGVSQAAEPIKIIGDQEKSGIFDVSVEYGDDGMGWMAYSRVQIPEYVETRLARSMDGGATWHFSGLVNPSLPGTQPLGGEKIQGVWRNETPSLLYDRMDVPARRWKVFSERYLTKAPYRAKDTLHGGGWVEYRYAATPMGPWSDPVRLFGSKESGSQIDLNMLDPALSGFSFYNEIGSIEKNGVIYLSLDASATASGLGEWEKRKIILVASLDHGQTWKYLGVLTDYKDASAFGYLVFTGSSLVESGGKIYALLTPSGKKGLLVKNRGHDGIHVVPFEDITRAKLKRDATGKLMVTKIMNIAPTSHSGGLADYHEKNIRGGIVFPQIDLKRAPAVFQTYSTGQRP